MDLRRAATMASLAAAPVLVLALVSSQPAASQPALANPAFKPDPANVKFILSQDIPWTGAPGRQQQYNIVGDASKPGPYVMLLKWWPNQFSQPHMHDKTRYITVVSGTWWMSSSPVYDPTRTYPMPQGTVVVHEARKVHWDGAKDEPTVLMIAGEGPASTLRVDAQGNLLPPAAPAGAGAAP